MRLVLLFFLLSVSIVSYHTANNTALIVSAARSQIGRTLTYNPEYVKLDYPKGDINSSKGVCTDVVVRALRALNIDLQEKIYKDKQKNPERYKGLYYTDRLDPNIDHRRVRNIQTYFASRGYRVRDKFLPGDIVVWELASKPRRIDHIGICSDRLNDKAEPYIIHNIGRGVQEEDVLRQYRIVDHFRLF